MTAEEEQAIDDLLARATARAVFSEASGYVLSVLRRLLIAEGWRPAPKTYDD